MRMRSADILKTGHGQKNLINIKNTCNYSATIHRNRFNQIIPVEAVGKGRKHWGFLSVCAIFIFNTDTATK